MDVGCNVGSVSNQERKTMCDESMVGCIEVVVSQGDSAENKTPSWGEEHLGNEGTGSKRRKVVAGVFEDSVDDFAAEGRLRGHGVEWWVGWWDLPRDPQRFSWVFNHQYVDCIESTR